MKAEDLYGYADRFATRHENAGQGTVYPTLRQCARRFRTMEDRIQSQVTAQVSDQIWRQIEDWLRASGYKVRTQTEEQISVQIWNRIEQIRIQVRNQVE